LSGLARLPNLINGLAAFECLNTTFHDADNLALARLGVDAPGIDHDLLVLGVASPNTFRIAKYGEIGVVRGKDELVVGLDSSQQLSRLPRRGNGAAQVDG
jgi:hypothetical protein